MGELFLTYILMFLLLPLCFLKKKERKNIRAIWKKAFRNMLASFVASIKKVKKEEQERKALSQSQKKFNDAFESLWNNKESLRQQVHGWNVEKNEIYFLNPLNDQEFDDFNRNLKDYSRTIHVNCEYQIVGITVPGLREGYGQLFVANFIYKKKADIEEAERLAKLAETRNNQEVDEVQSVL